jgi:hypothetical protein
VGGQGLEVMDMHGKDEGEKGLCGGGG